MVAAVRLALQIVLFFMLLSVVIAVGSAGTGFVEKGVLVALGGALIWAASLVRRIGAGPVARSN